MPLRLATPLLMVDAGKMHEIDTSNVENLFSMWTVFNRCAESMEEGRRLENLSWRLWNRETFCCDSKPRFPDTPTSQVSTPKPLSKKNAPELSTSVDSIASEDDEQESISPSPPVHIRRQSSTKSSTESFLRSKGKSTTSQVLEQMVVSIKNTKVDTKKTKTERKRDLLQLSTSLTEALPPMPQVPRIRSPPRAVQHAPATISKTQPKQTSPASVSSDVASPASSMVDRSQTFESDTSADSAQAHSIVRGFAPNKISSSQRSSTSLARSPIPTRSALRHPLSQKKPGNFMLGGGSSEDESSFDDAKSLRKSGSSLTLGLRQSLQQQPKMTTFKEEVEMRAQEDADEDAIDSDDSDAESDVSESAIEEDEDDEAWEDDDSSAQPPGDQGLFKRVPSKPNLVSRRSLLTTGLHESDRAAALAAQASKSQPSLPQLSRNSRSKPEVRITEPPQQVSGISRSKPMAMPITQNGVHYALSPKTTRRNMLSTELTESLRQNILCERKFKNVAVQALKRRHTAHENLNKLQRQPTTDSEELSRKASWNNVFNIPNEYNTRGW